MTSVPTSIQGLLTGTRVTAGAPVNNLSFDPIANREPGRPQFRLDDYERPDIAGPEREERPEREQYDDIAFQTLPPPATPRAADTAPRAEPASGGTSLPARAATPAAPPAADNAAPPPASLRGATAGATAPGAAPGAPRIEVGLSGSGAPQIAGDSALVTNTGQGGSPGGSSTANSLAPLPSQSETIAAATALNSRAPGTATQNTAAQGTASQSGAPLTQAQLQAQTQAQNITQPQNIAQNLTGQVAGTPLTPGAIPATETGVSPLATAAGLIAGDGAAGRLASAAGQNGAGQNGAGQGGAGQQGAAVSAAAATSRGGEIPAAGAGGFAGTLRAAAAEGTGTTGQPRQTLPDSAAGQVKVKLTQAARSGLDQIRIQLNPSELGKVDVRLEFGSDGGVRGIVTVEKPETLNLLQRDARQLEQALQEAGFRTGNDSLDFRMQGGGTGQQNNGTGNDSPSAPGGDPAAGDDTDRTIADETEQDGFGDDGSLNMVA